MTINIKAASISAGIVAGVISLICAFFVAVAPQATLKVGNSIFHGLDIAMIAKQSMTFNSIIIGLIVVMILSAAAVAIFGYFYNKFIGR